ncbi:phosphate ABC transporter permease subunit PstC [Danxiaibacter flavus]|uniref:Phosphate transport system permease protein n=1 Tax=Danxiaibacter flavus TaxID=3049108 RepID=A0ABV3ZPL2_9BACT|nr:phosphate ABC transporter permease subunit PstC [Chitinophagaceae bacterium DXS]
MQLKRKLADKLSSGWMIFSLAFFLLLPLAIGVGLVLKSKGLLHEHSLLDLLFSGNWAPSQNKFGFWPFIISSLWVTILAIVIAAPVCLLSAIYLSQFAPRWALKLMRPVIDILAGIPSVIYGVWGILVMVPFVSSLGAILNKETTGFSILAAALVLAVMTIPYVLNMLLEVFRQIPVELQEASLSLGATRWETIKHIILRKGLSGIISAIGLGFSKALGETIAVLMVVGNVVQLPKNAFSSGYTLPSLIANNYGEMMSIPSYDAALMFGALLLFAIILAFNFLFRYIIYKSEAL